MLLLIIFNIFPYFALLIASSLPSSLIDNGIDIFASIGRLNSENYKSLINEFEQYQSYFFISILISFATSFIVTVSSFLGAYGLNKCSGLMKSLILWAALIGYLLPPIVLISPYLILLKIIGLNGTSFGLILSNTAFCFPFGFWLMNVYIKDVPEGYFRASQIDGARWYSYIRHILLPRVIHGVWATIAFTWILSYNDLAFSLNLNFKTFLLKLNQDFLEVNQNSYGIFAAASALFAGFAVIFFGVLQYVVDSSTQREEDN